MNLMIDQTVFRDVTKPFQDAYDLENLGKLSVRTLNAGEHYYYHPSQGALILLVMRGFIEVKEDGLTICLLQQGGYMEFARECLIHAQEEGAALLIEPHYYRGIFRGGFELPNRGVFDFIDGCTDTLLLSPLVKGLPCLNFLYIPPKTIQTKHTHPSIRIGLVISGYGHCVVEDETFELKPKQFFVVQANSVHQFLTLNDELRIFVFHTDSDFGPSNEEHPMINKSFIEGVSVTKLKQQSIL